MAYPLAQGVVGHSGSYTPELFCKRILVVFYTVSVLAAISNTDYQGEIKSMGDKVTIVTMPDPVIHDYVIGQGLTRTKPEPGYIEMYVDKGKYFSFPVNNLEKFQSHIDYVDQWAAHHARMLKIAIERPILADIVGDAHASNRGLTAGYLSGSYNLGVAGTPLELTTANILRAIADMGGALDELDVPDNDRFLVLPVWAAQKIKQSWLSRADASGDSVSMMRNGQIGKIDRFTIYSSNLLDSTLDGADTCHSALFGQKSALSYVDQFVETRNIENPDDFGRIIESLNVYGYKVVKPEALGTAYITPGTET